MPDRNTPFQPHEFMPSKMEAVVGSIKDSSAEKIDLVYQKLVTAQQQQRVIETYFLRFWRLAEGLVTLQEIPMDRVELRRLSSALRSEFRMGRILDDANPTTDSTVDTAPYSSTKEEEKPNLFACSIDQIEGGEFGGMWMGSGVLHGRYMETKRYKTMLEAANEFALHIQAYPQKLEVDDATPDAAPTVPEDDVNKQDSEPETGETDQPNEKAPNEDS